MTLDERENGSEASAQCSSSPKGLLGLLMRICHGNHSKVAMPILIINEIASKFYERHQLAFCGVITVNILNLCADTYYHCYPN